MKKLFFPLIAIIMAVAAYAGQDVLKIHLKDGSTQTIAVSAIDSLTFEQMQSAGTFSVVDLTTKSVELKFVPAKTLGAFNIGVIKASDLNAFANDEAFCADQAKKFDADAKSWDMSLSEYLDFSLYKGNEIDDTKTFPYSDLEEGTEYVAYAYGVKCAAHRKIGVDCAYGIVEKGLVVAAEIFGVGVGCDVADVVGGIGVGRVGVDDA